MDKAQMINLVVSVLSSGVFTLIVGVFIYLVLPKLLAKASKYIDSDTLDKIGKGIGKLSSIKSAMDTDPQHEDMVEKILRYTELSVHAAEQAMRDGNDPAKKKQFAKDMAANLLATYKKQTKAENVEVSDMEYNIIDGLIETVVGVQKKAVRGQLPIQQPMQR